METLEGTAQVQVQAAEALTTDSVTVLWRGQAVHRRCGWCMRRMRHGDATHTAYGEPAPDLRPTTDSICRDCRATLH